MTMEQCGEGLCSRLVRLRESLATETKMRSTFEHPIEKKSIFDTVNTSFGYSVWFYQQTDNINNLMNIAHTN